MIELPDFTKAFEYENNFYLSCDNSRIEKIISHYELFKMTNDLPGAIVECGVFKGASLCRFAAFREAYGSHRAKKIIGFDMFADFPETNYKEDKLYRQNFIDSAGSKSISLDQLKTVLSQKGVNKNIELIAGNINSTVPEYVLKNPNLKISLLNLDTDIYEPAVTILEHLFPRIVRGGILIIDDYGVFPGETKAVDEFFKDQKIKVQKFPFSMTPSFVVKD